MISDALGRSEFADLARDPLVRLVMASDGVSEAELVTVLQTAQRAVAARTAAGHNLRAISRRRLPSDRILRRT